MSAKADNHVRTWIERIDDTHIAAIAFCEIIKYGHRYAVSFFIIVDVPDRGYVSYSDRAKAREAAEAYFWQQLDAKHYGRLPPADNQSW